MAGGTVTYLDLASRLGPDNKVSKIIEMLNQTNEILNDMVTKEGNLQTGHKSVIRTGLPAVAWRLLNYGVAKSKSTTAQVTDTCGMLEAYAEVDKDLAMLNGNTADFRLSEDQAFLEAMNQAMALTLFYGSTAVNPERFTGLTPRYSSGQIVSSLNPLLSAYNVVNAYSSASGADQYSMWLIVWGDNTIHGIYPQGSEAGFIHEDRGQQTVSDGAGGQYEALRTHYQWKLGLCVKDWRYAVRIANIDASAITSSTVDILAAMTDAYYKIPSFAMGKACFYAPPFVLAWLHKQAAARTNVIQTTTDPAGRPIVSFLGIPIRRCDQLVQESLVSFA
jgi:hypothetical protein